VVHFSGKARKMNHIFSDGVIISSFLKKDASP
jgi:hypothetical protein